VVPLDWYVYVNQTVLMHYIVEKSASAKRVADVMNVWLHPYSHGAVLSCPSYHKEDARKYKRQSS
jgi:hypothetical protein